MTKRTSVPAYQRGKKSLHFQHASAYIKKHLGANRKFARSKVWVYSSQSWSLLGVKSERSLAPCFRGFQTNKSMII